MFLLDEFVFLITKDEEALMDTETDTENTWMIKYNYYYAPAAVVRLIDLSLLHRLHSLSSSSSSTCTSLLFHCSLHHLPGQVVPTLPEIPILSTASYLSASKLQLIHHPTKLFLHPLLFLSSSFDGPLDTQTFLATISVLAAIALSLFLGLKGDPVPCGRCAGNGNLFLL
ncbi:hypothetical protein LOK49_LG15G02470 [Camellia lanceoleosa]|uniref:Uncharacterized protein n=1 Tax=Camellia lanceoleosa TaxID=1840588 RepID=A0ACC0F301_9ERIC|nr:hypothetical protein LOK49_LG15G02470 [Camellia lanceoleosa]